MDCTAAIILGSMCTCCCLPTSRTSRLRRPCSPLPCCATLWGVKKVDLECPLTRRPTTSESVWCDVKYQVASINVQAYNKIWKAACSRCCILWLGNEHSMDLLVPASCKIMHASILRAAIRLRSTFVEVRALLCDCPKLT